MGFCVEAGFRVECPSLDKQSSDGLVAGLIGSLLARPVKVINYCAIKSPQAEVSPAVDGEGLTREFVEFLEPAMSGLYRLYAVLGCQIQTNAE